MLQNEETPSAWCTLHTALLWELPCACPPLLTQAPLPGHLAGSRLGLPSIFRYRAVSVLLWAACFFTSFESSAWIVCERGVLVRAGATTAAGSLLPWGPGARWGWNHWDMGAVYYSPSISKVGGAVCIL